jgi:hypothetical protein
MSFSLFNWYSILALYLAFTTFLALHIYKKYYFFFYPIKDESGSDLHEKYPEFKKQEKGLFTLQRLILGLPFALPRVIIASCIAVMLFIYLK